MAQIRVTPRKLENEAKQMEQTNKQISVLTQDMLNQVSNLTSSWAGDAATAYIGKFKKLQDDMQKMHNMINRYARNMRDMANEYSKTEEKNRQAAEALKNNLIQD